MPDVSRSAGSNAVVSPVGPLVVRGGGADRWRWLVVHLV